MIPGAPKIMTCSMGLGTFLAMRPVGLEVFASEPLL